MRGGDRYATAASPADDPLAELARLIGQGDPADDYAPNANTGAQIHDHAYEPAPEAGSDWSADDRYVQLAEPAALPYPEEDQSGPAFDPRYDGRLEAPQDPRQSYQEQGYREEDHRGDYREDRQQHYALQLVAREAVAPAAQTELPQAPPPRMNARRDEARAYATAPQLPINNRAPVAINDTPLPAFPPRAREDHFQDERYQYDEQEFDGAEDQGYEPEDYEDEAPKRRSGLVMVAALFGLVVLGTAGAFAYRTMFGNSMLPSLPPIIKADTGPNKIVPTAAPGATQAGAGAGGGSGEKLVSREEKPVDVPAPVNTAPRVVSTIPVFPAPDTQGAGMASMAPGMTAPVTPTPVAPPTGPAGPPLPTAAAAVPAAPVTTPEPKKIHTVAIRPDQMGGTDAPAAAPASPPPRVVAAPSSAPRPASPPAMGQPAPQRASANAPLSIVPTQGEALVAPVRTTRSAVAQPTAISPAAPAPAAAPAPSAGVGYTVQVTSQRSEAEAQSAFRALSAKFPGQLGNQQPIIRRADLGDKGVFYRALVGPYASMEQAAGVCSSLKAAGGTCIVQRN